MKTYSAHEKYHDTTLTNHGKMCLFRYSSFYFQKFTKGMFYGKYKS